MLIQNIGRLITMNPGDAREGPLGVISKAAVWIDDGQIKWLGPEVDLPVAASSAAATAIDAEDGVVMPGLVDAHTHVVHAGTREREFARRARGESYQQIAAGGGGILSTVRATRAATEDELFDAASKRVWEALRRGTTTMEIKSGYGLTVDDELKILRVVQRLQKEFPLHCVPTLLAAHVVPEEFLDRRAAYVELICTTLIPRVAELQLAEYCDVFVDEGAFTAEEARQICRVAAKAGLRIRLHVDQFQDGAGGALAAELGAVSADHLDAISDAGIQALAKAGVVAGLLPGASFFIGRGRYPPVAKLVKAGVPIALATDYNPGTSPTLDLFLCATIAITQMGLDPDLALHGITRIAAQSLGRSDRVGSLAVGMRADLLVLDCRDEYFPLYRFGSSSVRVVMIGGEIVCGE